MAPARGVKRKIPSINPNKDYAVKQYLAFRVWRSEDRQIHKELLVEWMARGWYHQWISIDGIANWKKAKIISQVILLGKNYGKSIRELFSSYYPNENKCLEVYIRGEQALITVSLAPIDEANGTFLHQSMEDLGAGVIPVPYVQKITGDVEVDEDEWIEETGTSNVRRVKQVERTSWRMVSSISEGVQMENTYFKPTSPFAKSKWPAMDATPKKRADFEMQLGHFRANDTHAELKKMSDLTQKRQTAGGLSARNEQPNAVNEEHHDLGFYTTLFDITVWSDDCCGNCNGCAPTSQAIDNALRLLRERENISPSKYPIIQTSTFLKQHFYKLLTGDKYKLDKLFVGFYYFHCYFCPDTAAEDREQIKCLRDLYFNCCHCKHIMDCLKTVDSIIDEYKDDLEMPIGLHGNVFGQLHNLSINYNNFTTKRVKVKN